MGLQIATITSNIAALSISGVTILDIDEIKEGIKERDGATFFPNPIGFVTDLRVEPVTLGSAGARSYNVWYSLHYVLAYAPIGSGRGIFDKYPSMVATAFSIIDALIANDALAGTQEFQVQSIPEFGPVSDPSGKMHHGCQIVIDIMEFVN
jgi:hypothetical protein